MAFAMAENERTASGSFKQLVREALETAERISGHVVVDGRLKEAGRGNMLDVENPADRTRIGYVPRCDRDDVKQAVLAAHRAAPNWAAMPARERGDLLYRVVTRLADAKEELARLVCLETGNALSTQARPEIAAMLDMFQLFAGLGSEIKGRTIPWEGNTLCYTTREPLGVVGGIIPWNAPLFLTAAKLGPALVAGNTVVLKSAEQAPLAVLRCLEIIQGVLPPGVANVISGFGEEAGRPLAEHPLVRKITFTGSGAVGRQVLHYAADKLCPVTLELGGKSPNVIASDADLKRAIPGVISGMRFTRQGQSCSAGSRILVHDDIYEDVVERLLPELAKLRVGDPMQEETEVGTLISQEQYDRVLSYLDAARRTPGVSILCGGGRPQDLQSSPGLYLAPTLIEGVPLQSPVCQEEIFGPVALLERWRDFDAMIESANATDYGLAAAIWTSDLSNAMRFASRAQAGFVQVNQYITPRANVAYGGLKQSGLGKENTLESMLDHFTCSKTVIVNYGDA